MMTILHWLNKLTVIPVLITVRKSWTMNNLRLGYLSKLNTHITFITPNHPIINPNDQTNFSYLKPGNNILISITKYLNNKFNSYNYRPIKLKILINKIKYEEVGYKFENILQQVNWKVLYR